MVSDNEDGRENGTGGMEEGGYEDAGNDDEEDGEERVIEIRFIPSDSASCELNKLDQSKFYYFIFYYLFSIMFIIFFTLILIQISHSQPPHKHFITLQTTTATLLFWSQNSMGLTPL